MSSETKADPLAALRRNVPVGSRVSPTAEYPGTKRDRQGTVVGHGRYHPTLRVRWDGRQTSSDIHVDFLRVVAADRVSDDSARATPRETPE